jgi:hypothetical protein
MESPPRALHHPLFAHRIRPLPQRCPCTAVKADAEPAVFRRIFNHNNASRDRAAVIVHETSALEPCEKLSFDRRIRECAAAASLLPPPTNNSAPPAAAATTAAAAAAAAAGCAVVLRNLLLLKESDCRKLQI